MKYTTLQLNQLLHLVDQADRSAEAQAKLNRFAVENSLGDGNTDARNLNRRVKEFAKNQLNISK